MPNHLNKCPMIADINLANVIWLRLNLSNCLTSSTSMQVLLIGTGEYTLGLPAPSSSNKSDKKLGVIGVAVWDLRQRGFISEISLCGTDSVKTRALLKWVKEEGAGCVYPGLDVSVDSVWPEDGRGQDFKACWVHESACDWTFRSTCRGPS